MATRVLVVDDEPDSAAIIADLLRIYGCEVRCTSNPLEALTIAQQFQPEAICVDLSMPWMDGYAVAKAMRESPGLQNTRIIALSGYSPDRDRMDKAGIDDQLLKPVAISVLSSTLCPDAQAPARAPRPFPDRRCRVW